MSLSVAAVRVLLFAVLPLVLAAAHVLLDKRVRHRVQRYEVFMLYVLAVGVAGSGIGGFFAHDNFGGQFAPGDYTLRAEVGCAPGNEGGTCTGSFNFDLDVGDFAQ